MGRMLVLHAEEAKVVAWVRRWRAATITVLFVLILGFAWVLAAAPPFVGFGLAVASAVAWCIWLEKHPEAQTERVGVLQTQHLAPSSQRRPAKAKRHQTGNGEESGDLEVDGCDSRYPPGQSNGRCGSG